MNIIGRCISWGLICAFMAISAQAQVLAPDPLRQVATALPVTATATATPPANPPAAAPATDPIVPPSKVASRPSRPVQMQFADGSVHATWSAPIDVIEVGQALPFTLQVRTDDESKVTMPEIDKTSRGFDISDIRRDFKREGSLRSWTLTFNARTYKSGQLEFPPLELKWTDMQDVAHSIEVGPTAIEVVSLIGAEFDANKYQDIKGAVDIDLGGPWWWIAAASAVALAAGLVWALRVRQKTAAATRLSAHEIAQLELDHLERDGLIERGELHEFWVRLSGTVRQYVENRFDIAATEQTTKEFLAEARDHPLIGAEHRHLLTDFLRAADMVKFAAHRPASQDCIAGLDAARGFVRDTAQIAARASEEMMVKS